MTSADRRARERQLVQDKILGAARELFAAHGFEAVTLRKIAAAIEYAPAAIYGHFADKEQLIRTLCVRDFDDLAALVRPMAELADPIERISAVGRVYVRFAIEHPNQYRLMFMQPSRVEPDAAALERKGDPHRDAYAFLRHAVCEAIELGRVRPEVRDAELVTQTIWAAVHGVVSLELAFQGDEWIEWRPIEARSGAMIDAVIAGLTLPPRASRTKGARR
ncbi:MAG: TetR/AcrR family transcriptional regulator [Planctomycetes bacterium]|nr:TetR/AcrR family transcriptional regulator [Planctomycetota bacterium]